MIVECIMNTKLKLLLSQSDSGIYLKVTFTIYKSKMLECVMLFSKRHDFFCHSDCSLTDAPQSVWVNASQEVMEGSSVVLHCEVDSNPVSRISWYFGDEELLSETASNVSLFLENLNPTQEGIYTCVGDNGYGVMNTSMYLAVKCEFTQS